MSFIPKSLWKKHNGHSLSIRKGEVIFREGEIAFNFFQVEEGIVKMVSLSQQGREFIQGIFQPGQSFGEPPLICHFAYPASAIALSDGIITRIPKSDFLELLRANFDIHMKLDQVLCQRLKYKNGVLTDITFRSPEDRLLRLMKHLREQTLNPVLPFHLPLTRQQLADMTGLRVETVIRSIRKLERDKKLFLSDHKVILP
jgi:CRP-like cAMP-binding protein